MFNKKHNNFINISFGIITAVLVFYVLGTGKSFIIPFVIALLLSFAIIGLSNFYKSFKIPAFISFTLSIFTYGAIFWLVGKIIEANYDDFVKLAPEYFETISGIVQTLGDRVFGFLDIEKPESFRQLFSNVNPAQLFNRISSGVLEITGQLGIIIFYTLFLLLEYRYAPSKLDLMFSDGLAKKKIFNVLNQIQSDVKSYFVIKASVSFFVGLFSYTIMMIFGLEFAIFFAFIIFLLNFIPNIGSIIAVLFPVLFSLVQFESLYLTSIFLALMIGVQILMGNFVEPKFVGNKLNLSPLVIILSLVFWGKLWGVAGMFLSVPIMVIINIVLAAIPSTRSLAILFSEKGVLKLSDDDVNTTTKKLVKDLKKKLQDTKKQLKK
ncbi:AI-2E family transporter [Candidatus Gracilibacteria bacterium]|nr:AI-2E family transporter [Candidatus Gracilibacteria bacterium]